MCREAECSGKRARRGRVWKGRGEGAGEEERICGRVGSRRSSEHGGPPNEMIKTNPLHM